MKLSTLSMAILASAISASASPAIHLPGVKDAFQLDPSIWNWNKEEVGKNFQSTPMMAPAAEIEDKNFAPLWVERIDDCDGEAEEMYNKLIALNDDCYLEVYTSGAGKLFYEGRVTKLDADGKEKWTAAIQLGSYTRAVTAAEDGDGNIFVGCTTQEGSLVVPYIVSFSADGNQEGVTRLNEGAPYSVLLAVEGLDKGYAAVYSTGQSAWDWSFNVTLTVRQADGQEISSCTEETQYGDTLGAQRLGNILMIPFYTGEALFFNIADGTLAMRDKAPNYDAFQNGCASGDALFLLSSPWGGLVSLSKYEVNGNDVEKVWTLDTPYYHMSYNLYVFPANAGGVIIYVKTKDKPQALIMSSEGVTLAQNNNINFGKESNSNWVYSGGQLEDGTVALFGMTESTYELGIMTLDENLKPIESKNFTNVVADHPYSYSYDNCSKLIGGDFLFSGFIRPSDYWNHGHTPVFALMDASTMELEWATTGDPGKTIRIEPKNVVVDENGNSYAFYLSFVTTRLTRYSPEGTPQWSKVIADEKYDHFLAPTILSNGNIVCGVMSVDQGIKVNCFDRSGESVYEVVDKSFSRYKMVGMPVVAESSTTGDILIAFSVYADEGSAPYLVKVTSEGKVAFAKTLTGFENVTEPQVVAIAADTEGGAIISGTAMCEDDVTCPMVSRVDAEGNVLWAISTPTDVYCPIVGMALNQAGTIYAYANTGYHGVLFTYDQTTGALKGYDVYSDDTNVRSNYEAIAIDQAGNALIGASYIGEYWSTYESKALAFDAQANRLWDVPFASDNGARYACNNIGIITDQPVLLVNSQSYDVDPNELLVFIEDNEVVEVVDCIPASDESKTFQFCNSAIRDNRAYIFYYTRFGDNVYYGNLCCVGAPQGQTKLEPIVELNHESDAAQTPVYFNLQGVRMPQGQLPAGIYIKRQGNHTEKVVVR